MANIYTFNDSVPFGFDNNGKLVTRTGKPINVNITRQATGTFIDGIPVYNYIDKNGNKLTEQEVTEKVTDYFTAASGENTYKSEKFFNNLPEGFLDNAKIQPKVVVSNGNSPKETTTNNNSNNQQTNTTSANEKTTPEAAVNTSADQATIANNSTESTAASNDINYQYDYQSNRIYIEDNDEAYELPQNIRVSRKLVKNEDGTSEYKTVYRDLSQLDEKGNPIEITEEEFDKKVKESIKEQQNINDINQSIDDKLKILKGLQQSDSENKSKKNTDSEEQMGPYWSGSDEFIPLTDELLANQGLLGWHPINGQFLETTLNEPYLQYLSLPVRGHEKDLIKNYRNKLFGSGFQFLDSVDKRFKTVNEFVGYEYLRNFMMHSAILHIYPGMPHYQGGADPFDWLKALLNGSQGRNAKRAQREVFGAEPTEITKPIEMTKETKEAVEKLTKEGKKIIEGDPEKEGKTNEQDIKKSEEQKTPSEKIASDEEASGSGDSSGNQPSSGGNLKNNSAWSGLLKAIFLLFFKTKYQRRLFGIRYTYEQYMRYVNMMCRTMALFLNLTVMNQSTYPQGTFTMVKTKEKALADSDSSIASKFVTFDAIDWSNYRMIEDANSYVKSTFKNSLSVLGVVFTRLGTGLATTAEGLLSAAGNIGVMGNPIAFGAYTLSSLAAKVTTGNTINQLQDKALASTISLIDENSSIITDLDKKWTKSIDKDSLEKEGESAWDKLKSTVSTIWSNTPAAALGQSFQTIGAGLKEIFSIYNAVQEKLEQRTQSVEFMVEPVSPQEQFQNQTQQSIIKSYMDKASGVGTEVGFITQTNAIQDGAFGKALEGIAKTGSLVIDTMNGLASNIPVAGSFLHNLISGALGAVTGNRYIFPDIYQSSNSSTSFTYKINLVSPYGDTYNYFMNIIVPLCHLYCLVNPRLVTANSSNSPFIVRAFIPGLTTCELGIIDSMTVHKNSEGNRVSTNGFPLSVTVEFSIHELYHHNAISPWDDPLSVLNNECLLDYLCNLAGVPPTYSRTQLLAVSLNNIINLQQNFSGMIENYIGDALLAWFGTTVGTRQ